MLNIVRNIMHFDLVGTYSSSESFSSLNCVLNCRELLKPSSHSIEMTAWYKDIYFAVHKIKQNTVRDLAK